jgi:hypothetical protein
MASPEALVGLLLAASASAAAVVLRAYYTGHRQDTGRVQKPNTPYPPRPHPHPLAVSCVVTGYWLARSRRRHASRRTSGIGIGCYMRAKDGAVCGVLLIGALGFVNGALPRPHTAGGGCQCLAAASQSRSPAARWSSRTCFAVLGRGRQVRSCSLAGIRPVAGRTCCRRDEAPRAVRGLCCEVGGRGREAGSGGPLCGWYGFLLTLPRLLLSPGRSPCRCHIACFSLADTNVEPSARSTVHGGADLGRWHWLACTAMAVAGRLTTVE